MQKTIVQSTVAEILGCIALSWMLSGDIRQQRRTEFWGADYQINSVGPAWKGYRSQGERYKPFVARWRAIRSKLI